MFIIFLKFSANRNAASQHMAGHKAWIDQGFEDGVFMMSGSLTPGRGGVVMAQGEVHETLEARVKSDPFVTEEVVTYEIHPVDPARVNWP